MKLATSLIDEALAKATPPLPASGRVRTIVKSTSARQRPRRTRAYDGRRLDRAPAAVSLD
jgi:hypothetical protein